MRELGILKPFARIEDATALDPVVARARGIVESLLRPRWLEDVLHGVPAGHPVHPVLVQIPIGTWASAAILDLLPGTARTSRLLVGVGLVAAAPAILTGWADWARSHRQQQRVGFVHATTNAVGVNLYAGSWLARRTGHEAAGRLLGWTGFGLIGLGGYLGGHLAYRQAVGANHAEAVVHRFPAGWQMVGPVDELPEGRPVRRDVAGEAVLLIRRGTRIDALSNVCTHLGAPLDEGTLDDRGAEGACITCPWHASVFELDSGEVIHGPATAPQPRFEARVQDGIVEVSLPRAAGAP